MQNVDSRKSERKSEWFFLLFIILRSSIRSSQTLTEPRMQEKSIIRAIFFSAFSCALRLSTSSFRLASSSSFRRASSCSCLRRSSSSSLRRFSRDRRVGALPPGIDVRGARDARDDPSRRGSRLGLTQLGAARLGIRSQLFN